MCVCVCVWAFQVESDHTPLEILNLKNVIAAPPRLQRMLLRLQGYDMIIVYRSGKKMTLADGFSRPTNKKAKEIDLDIKWFGLLGFMAYQPL